MVVRPWLQVPSNCIAPTALVETAINGVMPPILSVAALCPGADRMGSWNPNRPDRIMNYWRFEGVSYDPLAPYNPDTVGLPVDQGGSGAPNGGRGFTADLRGNDLPNAPHWTANIGAQYTFVISDWNLTLRGDYYWQAESYARVYNTEFDRLKAWDNSNFSVTLDHERTGLVIQAYVKNAFDDTPITDFFLNSDDTGLTANVFTLDPRLIGVSVSKRF